MCKFFLWLIGFYSSFDPGTRAKGGEHWEWVVRIWSQITGKTFQKKEGTSFDDCHELEPNFVAMTTTFVDTKGTAWGSSCVWVWKQLKLPESCSSLDQRRTHKVLRCIGLIPRRWANLLCFFQEHWLDSVHSCVCLSRPAAGHLDCVARIECFLMKRGSWKLPVRYVVYSIMYNTRV